MFVILKRTKTLQPKLFDQSKWKTVTQKKTISFVVDKRAMNTIVKIIANKVISLQ